MALTPLELAEKIDYEGGIYSALEYGLDESDLDDSDLDLKTEWDTLVGLFRGFHPQVMAVWHRLPDPFGDPDEEPHG